MCSLSLFDRSGFVRGELAADDGALVEGRGGYMTCFEVAITQTGRRVAADAEEVGSRDGRCEPQRRDD